jgi:nitrogen fixation protein FixH
MRKKIFGWAALLAALLLGACDSPVNDGGGSRTGCDLLGFKIGAVEGAIDQTARTVDVNLPVGHTDATVAATISEGARISLHQAERNGTSVYRVTAENETDAKDYTVHTIWLGDGGSDPGSGCNLTAFKIGTVEGVIDQDARTVNVNLPVGHEDATVTATISPGARIALYKTERDGVSVYRVTAENGTDTRDYTVHTIWLGDKPEPGADCDLTAFKIGDVEGDIEDDDVYIILPSDQSDFAVTATISSGARIALYKTERDGVSVYRVTAEDGTTTKDYTVHTTRLGGTGITLGGGPFGGTDGTGGIIITSPNPAWPDNVTRTGGGGSAGLGANQIILTASDETCDSYRWYVDGGLLVYYNSDAPSPTGFEVNHLTGGNYAVGQHVLTLVAVKNGVPYTIREIFTVREN